MRDFDTRFPIPDPAKYEDWEDFLSDVSMDEGLSLAVEITADRYPDVPRDRIDHQADLIGVGRAAADAENRAEERAAFLAD